MAIEEGSAYCNHCNGQVLIRREVANHLAHALISLFLCGLWIPVWLVLALSPGPWRCSRCGISLRS